jgi:hypothetical protein
MPLAKYSSLKSCVSMFLDEHDKSMGDFDKAWVLAFRGMEKLGYAIAYEPKTLRLPVSGNKTVPFPTDYVSWTKIGILTNEGKVSTLKINNSITTFKDNNPNRLQQINGDVQSGFSTLTSIPYYLNYYFDGQYMPLFGVGGGLVQYGECRVDEKNNVVVLSPDFKYDSIIFEYINSPEMDGDYQILSSLREAVIAFIAWKMKLGARADFYGEAVEARRTLPKKKVTLQVINQVIRESTGMKLLA